MSFAALALRARAANDTTRAQINNIPSKSHVIPLFVTGQALRLFRTNSSKVMFEENIKNFRTRLTLRGYPNNLVDKIISEVKFEERKNALTQTQKAHKRILPFVTQFHPSLPCLKNILMDKWHLIENQPLLREITRILP